MTAGGTGPSRKRTPAEKDALAVHAARLHFDEGLDHPGVAARLDVKAAEVAGFLRRARQKGLIALRVDDPDAPRLDTVVGPMLERVSGVRRVVAVRTPPELAVAGGAGPDPVSSRDRALHQAVASGAARFLWDRIRDHDRIAVGAGRAVRFTVDAMAALAAAEPRSFSGLEILSLTGTPVVRRDPHDLDSDAIASELGHVLQVDGEAIHRVNFKYVATNPRSALRRVGSRLLEPEWGRERPPDIALLGLGVLDLRHHLMASRRDDKMVAPIRTVLDRLENEVLPACPSAVADVYDTFWVTEGALEPGLAEVARQLVDELNSRLVAIPRPKLDQAREKILVAAGAFKYDGILAYLRRSGAIGLRATVLVTDSVTATRLVTDLTAGPDPSA